MYCAGIVALASATWFELPEWLTSTLLAVDLVLALLVAICAGRTATLALAGMPYRRRPSITGRGIGMLALVVLGAVAIAIAMFVYPRTWPTSVDDAVAMLSAELDPQRERALAYMGYDELAELQDTFGASIRQRFGLNSRNFRLAYDCDPEYMHPHTCSSIIISRLWKHVRAALPDEERAALETLEANLDRVRLRSEQFDDVPLADLVAFFNDAIRAQLPADAQLTIVHDPRFSDDRVSTAWHVMDTLSLREALEVFTSQGHWLVIKDPPNLVIQPAASTSAAR